MRLLMTLMIPLNNRVKTDLLVPIVFRACDRALDSPIAGHARIPNLLLHKLVQFGVLQADLSPENPG